MWCGVLFGSFTCVSGFVCSTVLFCFINDLASHSTVRFLFYWLRCSARMYVGIAYGLSILAYAAVFYLYDSLIVDPLGIFFSVAPVSFVLGLQFNGDEDVIDSFTEMRTRNVSFTLWIRILLYWSWLGLIMIIHHSVGSWPDCLPYALLLLCTSREIACLIGLLA